MSKVNVLISTSSFAEYDKSVLDGLSKFNVILNPNKRTLKEAEIKALLIRHGVCGLIAGTEPLNEDVLTTAKSLRVISRCGAGVDNIDLNTAGKLGIKVFNTPDAPRDAVAELTLGLMLDCLRRISLSDRAIRKRTWTKPMGNLLKGKLVGIIGFGRIGKAVSHLIKAFGADIIYHDLVKDAEFDGGRWVELNELLRSADIITLHLPLLKADNYFIDAKKISLMKRGVIFVNTSRGGLVDEEALYSALNSGTIACAGLDVFEKEPYAGKLIELDNVVLTSHIGSYAVESRILMEKQAVDNLLKGLEE